MKFYDELFKVGTVLSHPAWGAWIEICPYRCNRGANRSHPAWGAWIEMTARRKCPSAGTVAPLAGAWIEIYLMFYLDTGFASHPSRVRGLKF